MSERSSSETRPAWRGDQRLRVEVVFDGLDSRVDALSVVDGPVVQRPTLTGNLVAVVTVDGELQLLQAFEDPRLVRAIAPPERIGHNFGLREEGRLVIDVPLSRDQPAHQLAIKLLDLSGLQGRPLEPGLLADLVSHPSVDLPVMAEIGIRDVAEHPDWQALKDQAAMEPEAGPTGRDRAIRSSGFSDDDRDEREGYTFEWWLHLPTRVVIAVRLDSGGRVAGAARPLTDRELRGPAKGFDWNEEPRFTAAVEEHRARFKRVGRTIHADPHRQRAEIKDDLAALGFR